MHSEISEHVKDRITEFARRLMICKGVPGMTISIVKENNVWVLPLGYRDLDDKSPVTEDTKFLIGSITKTFTAQLTAVMIQESNRKLSWDTHLKEILGSTFTMASDRLSEIVTLRDILSHRSGLVSGNLAVRASLPSNISRKNFLKLLRHIPVNQNQMSDEKFLYSNMGYTLAGALLEHWWNKSWEHLIEEKLFTPLGMTSSSVARTAEDLISKELAKPYVPTEGDIKASDPTIYVSSRDTEHIGYTDIVTDHRDTENIGYTDDMTDHLVTLNILAIHTL
ncbi:hypothetical protein Btru_003530 [Bulinus truncatus]|nr:hypothetical protein Btru_003530 [Bulinus truncatus]